VTYVPLGGGPRGGVKKKKKKINTTVHDRSVRVYHWRGMYAGIAPASHKLGVQNGIAVSMRHSIALLMPLHCERDWVCHIRGANATYETRESAHPTRLGARWARSIELTR
jgi:hypothetical protein